MRFEVNDGQSVAVDIVNLPGGRAPLVLLEVTTSETHRCEAISIDENYAAALVLQLQAAIAVIQARAVSL